MATEDIEVWPEYPLPLFLQLSGLHRVVAREEAREFRRRWLHSSWHFTPDQPFSTLLGRRIAAQAQAAAAAAGRLADNTSRVYQIQHVWGVRDYQHHLQLPVAAAAA